MRDQKKSIREANVKRKRGLVFLNFTSYEKIKDFAMNNNRACEIKVHKLFLAAALS